MANRAPILFREVQPFRQWHSMIVLAMPPLGLIFIAIRQMVFHHPFGTPPVSDGGLIFLTVLSLAVYLRLITVRLATEVGPHEIAVGLRGFGRKRRIPLTQIRAIKTVEYDAIRDFGGYGMRSGSRGRAYIAGGNRAVELEMLDGQKLLVGSPDPARLAQAIDSAKGHTK